MASAHVYFADVPLSPVAAAKEGHRSTFDSDDDATLQQRQSRDCSISPVPPGSNSPVPSTPRYERNMGFFRQLSRRFGLRSNDDLVYSGSNEDDNQSSSTDSCSSHAGVLVLAAKENCKDGQKQFIAMTEHISCNSSETSSTVDIEEQQLQLREQPPQQTLSETDSVSIDAPKADKPASGHKDRKSFARSSFSRLQRRSTTSIRRAFEAFSLSSRSLSCSGTTPPPPPLLLSSQSHTSSASSSTNNGTPIKSSLKSSSNLELNKKSAASASATTSSSFNTTSSSASATSAMSSSSSSSSWSSASLSATKSSSSKTKTKPPPQRILRQPVSYTYLKGISGLPTQRVPRNSVCCQYARR